MVAVGEEMLPGVPLLPPWTPQPGLHCRGSFVSLQPKPRHRDPTALTLRPGLHGLVSTAWFHKTYALRPDPMAWTPPSGSLSLFPRPGSLKPIPSPAFLSPVNSARISDPAPAAGVALSFAVRGRALGYCCVCFVGLVHTSFLNCSAWTREREA